MSRQMPLTHAQRGFILHLTTYILVNLLLVAINLTTSPNTLWFFWPLLGWGIGIGVHAMALFLWPESQRWR